MQTLAPFDGFADPDATFFRKLARNQNREWFQAHKGEYEDGYVAPMTALLEEVRPRIAPFFDRYDVGGPKIFRIYRDVRFSKDKTPYKTHIGGYLPLVSGTKASGRWELPVPLYVQLGAETFVGAGSYMLAPEQISHLRSAIDDAQRGVALVKLCDKLAKAGYAISGEALKTVPRGYDPEHPRAEWLKRKSLTIDSPPLPRDLLGSRRLIDWLVKATKPVAPLMIWLADATSA
jgi:uncharacterized protein (TIGR02453 family)